MGIEIHQMRDEDMPAGSWKFKGKLQRDIVTAGNLEQRCRQRYLIGKIEAVILVLEILPCDVDVRIKKEKGSPRIVCEGHVTAYGLQSFSIATKIIQVLCARAESYSKHNLASNLELTYCQTTNPGGTLSAVH